MMIQENISLRPYNSFGIEAKARYFTEIKNIDSLKDLMLTETFQSQKRFILGGGSNVLFADDFDGLIIKIAILGQQIAETNEDTIVIKAGAGEEWHRFVETCLRNKCYGLENLALIPGNIGAAPVQNIGAYGSEQKDNFERLECINLKNGEYEELSPKECRFGYRDSVFKHERKDNFIISSVSYRLSKKPFVNLSYGELKREAAKFPVVEPDPKYVFDTVCRLRQIKLPDPKVLGNAGSFFKNPMVDNDKYLSLIESYPDMPSFPGTDSKVKIPAAWLIEKCGWKGKRIGKAGVSDKHALIIVNYGGASGREIYDLSEEIISSVSEKFSINLEREVNLIR